MWSDNDCLLRLRFALAGRRHLTAAPPILFWMNLFLICWTLLLYIYKLTNSSIFFSFSLPSLSAVDVEHSHVRFLGNLGKLFTIHLNGNVFFLLRFCSEAITSISCVLFAVLNLWDCGGQESFMEQYFASQKDNIFRNVEVLIYVFDVESRELDNDMHYYQSCLEAIYKVRFANDGHWTAWATSLMHWLILYFVEFPGSKDLLFGAQNGSGGRGAAWYYF